MEAIAIGRYLRISTLKVRKIIKVIRGKSVSDALAILAIMPNKAAKMAHKVIFSAMSNFRNIFPEEDEKQLMIKAIFADEAPIFKRLLPRARGRADILRKQSTHLTAIVVFPEVEEVAEQKTEAKTKTKTKIKTKQKGSEVVNGSES